MQGERMSRPTMIPANSGSTGYTFLCRNDPEKFVLKWQKRSFCINELFCNTLISVYGFKTPATILLEKPLIAWSLTPHAVERKPSMPTGNTADDQPLDLLVMQTIPGINFERHLKTEAFWKLTLDNHIKLFSQLGSIIPFDLLIGNHDRILRIQLDFENSLSIDLDDISTFLEPNPSMNTGNVMIEVKRTDTSIDVDVSFIDSTTHPKMLAPKLKVRDASTSNLHLSLFNDPDEEYISPQSSSSPDSRMETDLEMKERCEIIFTKLFQHIFDKPEFFAEHAMLSIFTSIEQVAKNEPGVGRYMSKWQEEFEKEKEQYAQAILSGIQDSCELLIRVPEEDIQYELKRRFDDLKTKEIPAPDLLRKNLDSLKQLRG